MNASQTRQMWERMTEEERAHRIRCFAREMGQKCPTCAAVVERVNAEYSTGGEQ